ncbi:MAG: phage tail protein [Calditrichaceae bacterium]|nr:phage baseplate assembly protein V [Calditrichia bacterium]NUQ41382.1 phage tail protein [Calditrichaceae bacterium]
MSLIDLIQNRQAAADRTISGVAIAIVTNNQDPEGQARVKVKYPWRDSEDESFWARIATPMAGGERGAYFLPEVGDEVLIAFENGNIDYPYVLGSLWSGSMKPPESNSDGKNNRRLIKSRSGHLIILDDSDGQEKIEIIDKSGSNKITIDTSGNTISIESAKDIQLKAPNGKITLEALQLEMKSQTAAKIEAGANMDLKANANMTIKGAMVMIN